ncbi:hypothetical protein LSAT2_014042 [Lamellibrachia satsuma]|nr:hypothetical protein LSAT2_014042 [Lamellibrachia satsuma]
MLWQQSDTTVDSGMTKCWRRGSKVAALQRAKANRNPRRPAVLASTPTNTHCSVICRPTLGLRRHKVLSSMSNVTSSPPMATERTIKLPRQFSQQKFFPSVHDYRAALYSWWRASNAISSWAY